MKYFVSAALLLLLLGAVVPTQLEGHAQATPQIVVTSQFNLNRYGYAVINETVTFNNNGTSAVTAPDLTVGFGNLSSKIVAYNLTGSGFTGSSSNFTAGPFIIGGGQSIPAGASATFMLKALVNNIVSTSGNGSLRVLVLVRPSLSLEVETLHEVVRMPDSTQFSSAPPGLVVHLAGKNVTYSGTQNNVAPQGALGAGLQIKQITLQDFHPLAVYYAARTVSVSASGDPVVTDTLTFKNLGTTTLGTAQVPLVISPLTAAGAQVTVVPAAEPRLLNPAKVTLSGYGIILANPAIGNNPVPAGGNYTIAYQYPLDRKYYSVAGGQVTVTIPTGPPILAFVDTYALGVSVPAGFKVIQSPSQAMMDVTPWQSGQASVSYSLSVGWAVAAGIPAASAVFILLLLGLFVSRTTLTEEEETEEESSTERASAMIKAFEEKTSLINGLWPEVAAANPNEVNKEYFDELRGRLDAFRSRALQRLNEVKQRSTSQKFFDLLNQIHTTEREVDRAAKDKLNLYEQYYTRRMRKEVFDRLLPQYTKRLERALNQLSDELHLVQREAKLL